jgi:glucuronokinase
MVGNPSDGYHGKTVSLSVGNFAARATLYEWEQVEVVWSEADRGRFDSVDELVRDVRLHGYYGSVRLVKATIKKFVDFCRRQRLPLHDRNFAVRCTSDIPRQVGLAGSSAMIVATLRCLMDFYQVEIPLLVQPSLALSVETEELGIAAGLQDRVIQVYGGLVSMDFAQQRMTEVCGLMCGAYEPLDPALLPPLYLAYSADEGEPTEVIHNDLRARYRAGEPAVVAAMKRLAELADEARAALLRGDSRRLGELIDANFEQRRTICKLPVGQVQMVETARAAGATAHFTGSGGAILGTYPDESVFQRLQHDLGDIGCKVIKPIVA